MTSKVYRSAQGKSVDLGTIMLQNEHVRAVGNMNVNARGDKLDSNNQVIDTKPRQIQRQTARTTNVSAEPVHTSAVKVRKSRKQARAAAVPQPAEQVAQPAQQRPQPEARSGHISQQPQPQPQPQPTPAASTPVIEPAPTPVSAPLAQDIAAPAAKIPEGGLAAAIARNRAVTQELDKTRRQQLQAQGLRKI
jgi:hypothetical protein